MLSMVVEGLFRYELAANWTGYKDAHRSLDDLRMALSRGLVYRRRPGSLFQRARCDVGVSGERGGVKYGTSKAANSMQ